MDYEAGHAIDDKDWYEENNVDASKVVSKISYLFNEMIFVKGFLHSDPHAGNLKIRKVGPIGPVQIILLDHGQYRRLSSIFQNDFCNFLHSCVEFGKSPKKEHKRMLRYARRLGVTDTDLANQMACMVLGVRWSQITDGGGLTRQGRDKANNWGEKQATEEIIDKYLGEVGQFIFQNAICSCQKCLHQNPPRAHWRLLDVPGRLQCPPRMLLHRSLQVLQFVCMLVR